MSPEPKTPEAGAIPVTVLTGFLGSGKTTLLNRVLGAADGRKYAVIVNEFGEIGIDADLLVEADEEFIEMNNGCVCCTVRGDLVRTLHQLLVSGKHFDAIIIETTGLADPGPVAQTFFMDRSLDGRVRLDSVVALADAHHIGAQLDAYEEAVEQIAFADLIVLNKIDTVDENALERTQARLRTLNPHAPVRRSERGRVPLSEIFDRHGFDLDRILADDPGFLASEEDHGVSDHHGHHHTPIDSVSFNFGTPFDLDKVDNWLQTLLAEKGRDILRAKGILHIAGEKRRLVFHAVHMMLEADYSGSWAADAKPVSKLVFIGRNLDKNALAHGLNQCTMADA